MTERNVVRKIAVAIVAANLALAGWLAYAAWRDAAALMAVRQALFTTYTSDRNTFAVGVGELKRAYGFKTDSSREVREFLAPLEPEIPCLRLALPDTMSDRGRATSIVRAFSKEGGPGCGDFRNLEQALIMIARDQGYGCCSDHTEVFLALASWYGLIAREVHKEGHSFAEYYDRQARKWVWIDPEYALMAADAGGAYLSLMELRQHYYGGEAFRFICFGTAYHRFTHEDPRTMAYFDAREDFADIIMTLGNNVVEQDRFDRKVSFLPKPARQLLALVSGVQPGYLMYDGPGTALAPRYRTLRTVVVTTVSAVAIADAVLLLAFVRARTRRRRESASKVGERAIV